MTITTSIPLQFGRVRVENYERATGPDLSDVRVVKAILTDAKRVARREQADRRRIARG